MPTCSETVSILYALIVGAGEACISFSAWSIFAALLAFGVLVTGAQWLVKRVMFGASDDRIGQVNTGTRARSTANDGRRADNNPFRDGPVR